MNAIESKYVLRICLRRILSLMNPRKTVFLSFIGNGELVGREIKCSNGRIEFLCALRVFFGEF